MSGAVAVGVALAGAVFGLTLGWYRANCVGLNAPQLCALLNGSPPWVLLTSIAAAPAVLLTWFLRTTHKYTDIEQRADELRLRDAERSLRDQELQLQREQAAARAEEVKEQLELQRAQVAANAGNVDRQIQAAAAQQLRQIEANTSQQLEQKQSHAEEQKAQQAAQSAQLMLQQEQSRVRAEETRQQIEASNEANKIARETHALEVYMRAVDALGSESPDRQHAGIALLAQIARESEKYVTPAADVLAAFVKKHAQRQPPLTLPGARLSALPTKPDRSGSTVTAALRTVAALPRPEGHALDLRGIALRNVALSGGSLNHVDLSDSALFEVHFDSVSMNGINFSGIVGDDWWISDCSLAGANFEDAVITNFYLGQADLTDANFCSAELDGSYWGDPRMRGAEFNSETKSPIFDDVDREKEGMVLRSY